MEKEREVERRVEPPPAERDDVRVAGNRCPYCHEDVPRETADVCRDCLARHHAACWAEAPRCGACGSVEVLRPVRRDPLSSNEVRAIVAETLRGEGFATDGLEPRLSAGARCSVMGCERSRADRKLRCRRHIEEARRTGRRGGWALFAVALAVFAAGIVGSGTSQSLGAFVGGATLALVFAVVGLTTLRTNAAPSRLLRGHTPRSRRSP
jgi:hypothetical protein